jgi:hypothetical protein
MQHDTRGVAVHVGSLAVENLAISASDTYVQRNKCCVAQRSLLMIAAISKFFDALFAPLARELERIPASAFRYILAGL